MPITPGYFDIYSGIMGRPQQAPPPVALPPDAPPAPAPEVGGVTGAVGNAALGALTAPVRMAGRAADAIVDTAAHAPALHDAGIGVSAAPVLAPAGPPTPTPAEMAANAAAPAVAPVAVPVPGGVAPAPAEHDPRAGVMGKEGQVRHTPAHEVQTVASTAMDQYQQALGVEKKAELAATEARQWAKHDEQRAIQAQADKAQERIKAGEAAQAKHQDDARKLSEAAHADSANVDTWKQPDMEMPKGALPMLAIFLGGLFQNKDGSNPAITAFEKQIDTRVKQARMDYDMKKDKAARSASAYNHFVEQWGNDAAPKMYEAALLEKSKLDLRSMALRNGIAEDDAKLTEGLAKLDAKSLNLKGDAVKLVQGSTAVGKAQVWDPRLRVWMDKDKWAEQEHAGFIARENEGAKADTKLDDKTAEGTRFIADKMQAAKIPEVKAAAEEARKQLRASDGAGVGILGDAIHGAPKVGPAVFKKIYGDDASRSAQAWANNKNRLFSALSGSAVGPKEEERLKAQLDAAQDPASREEALNETLTVIAAQERNIYAGAGQRPTATYKADSGALKPKEIKESKF